MPTVLANGRLSGQQADSVGLVWTRRIIVRLDGRLASTALANYRKLAFDHYAPICAYCGYGVPEILEVAHLDGDRRNNAVENLAVLCCNCHKMHDIGLIPTDTIVQMRAHGAKASPAAAEPPAVRCDYGM